MLVVIKLWLANSLLSDKFSTFSGNKFIMAHICSSLFCKGSCTNIIMWVLILLVFLFMKFCKFSFVLFLLDGSRNVALRVVCVRRERIYFLEHRL